MKIKAEVNDVFSITLGEGNVCLGIVAAKWKSELYILIFREKIEKSLALSNINVSELTPYFASSSLDALIWHGRWPIIHKNVVAPVMLQPFYKVIEPQGIVAESFDRKNRVNASEEQTKFLRYRTCVAPIRLENAIRSLHGQIPWEPAFDELKYDYVLASNVLIMSKSAGKP